MAKATHDGHSALEQGAAALKDFPGEAIGAVQDVAMGVYDEARDRAGAFGDSFAKALRAKPYQTVAIAIGIGCVIGIIIARR